MKLCWFSLLAILALLLSACARIDLPCSTLPPCGAAYQSQLNTAIAQAGGRVSQVGDTRTIIIPSNLIFVGRSSNFTPQGEGLIKAIGRASQCHKEWQLSVSVYNAMFMDRRASKALARQQGRDIMDIISHSRRFSVADATAHVIPLKYFAGSQQQNLIKVVTKA